MKIQVPVYRTYELGMDAHRPCVLIQIVGIYEIDTGGGDTTDHESINAHVNTVMQMSASEIVLEGKLIEERIVDVDGYSIVEIMKERLVETTVDPDNESELIVND